MNKASETTRYFIFIVVGVVYDVRSARSNCFQNVTSYTCKNT